MGELEPGQDAVPFASPQSATLGKNEEATFSFVPEQSGTVFRTPAVAISKHPTSSYQVMMDGRVVFPAESGRDWAPLPPTDPDVMAGIWQPPREFETSLTVRVRNLGTSTLTYYAQPVGWEEDP